MKILLKSLILFRFRWRKKKSFAVSTMIFSRANFFNSVFSIFAHQHLNTSIKTFECKFQVKPTFSAMPPPPPAFSPQNPKYATFPHRIHFPVLKKKNVFPPESTFPPVLITKYFPRIEKIQVFPHPQSPPFPVVKKICFPPESTFPPVWQLADGEDVGVYSSMPGSFILAVTAFISSALLQWVSFEMHSGLLLASEEYFIYFLIGSFAANGLLFVINALTLLILIKSTCIYPTSSPMKSFDKRTPGKPSRTSSLWKPSNGSKLLPIIYFPLSPLFLLKFLSGNIAYRCHWRYHSTNYQREALTQKKYFLTAVSTFSSSSSTFIGRDFFQLDSHHVLRHFLFGLLKDSGPGCTWLGTISGQVLRTIDPQSLLFVSHTQTFLFVLFRLLLSLRTLPIGWKSRQDWSWSMFVSPCSVISLKIQERSCLAGLNTGEKAITNR